MDVACARSRAGFEDKLGFGCAFAMPISMARSIWPSSTDTSMTRCATSAAVGYAQPPQLFLNDGKGSFRDAAAEIGPVFGRPKVGRGLAYGDFDRDGDLDLLVTTNNGPAYLYRNDQTAGNRSIRFDWSAPNRTATQLARRLLSSTTKSASRRW